MAADRRVYDSCHLHVDCQEPGSAPEPYARLSIVEMPSVLNVFSALTLLAGCQEEHPACKNSVLRCWCGCLERGADCLHMVQLMPVYPKTPSSPDSFRSILAVPFWYWLTLVGLEEAVK